MHEHDQPLRQHHHVVEVIGINLEIDPNDTSAYDLIPDKTKHTTTYTSHT